MAPIKALCSPDVSVDSCLWVYSFSSKVLELVKLGDFTAVILKVTDHTGDLTEVLSNL